MSWHQNKAAAILTFLAIAILIVAATSSKSAVPGGEIVIDVSQPRPEGPSVSEAILASSLNTLTKAKASLIRTPSGPSYELQSAEDQGAIWDEGPAYDLSSTGQASIYVYVPWGLSVEADEALHDRVPRDSG